MNKFIYKNVKLLKNNLFLTNIFLDFKYFKLIIIKIYYILSYNFLLNE